MKMHTNNKNYMPALRGVIACFLAVALVVGINFAVSNLPKGMTHIDTTKVGVHTLSKETRKALTAVKDEVQIYLLAEEGQEDVVTVALLEKMASLNDKISLTIIDPAVNPAFVAEYVGDKRIQNNAIIVSSDKRSKYIEAGEYKNATYFLGEDYFLSAINYVTKDKLETIYCITGHNEQSIPQTITSTLSLDGYEFQIIDLVKTNLPKEAKMVLLLDPKQDLSKEESQRLLTYLQNGGRLMLVTGSNLPKQNNVLYLIENYGTEFVSGYVCEDKNVDRVSGMSSFIKPQVNINTETEEILQGITSVIMPLSYGVREKEEHRDTVTVYNFLRSTDESYAKKDWDGSGEVTKAQTDATGPFTVGTAMVEENGEVITKIMWLTSVVFLDSEVNEVSDGQNYSLFLNGVDWLDDENISTLNAKIINTRKLKIMTPQKILGGTLLIGIIPFVFLIAGVIVWVNRRVR